MDAASASPPPPPTLDMPTAANTNAGAGRWTRIYNGVVLGRGDDLTSDLYLCDDRVAAPPPPGTPMETTIDAGGGTVMAGGIDLHTHIGGGKLTIARMAMGSQLRPMENPERSECLPTADVAAQRYLDMGYTTAMEPAIIAAGARASHLEMSRCHGLATGGYCLLGNEPPLLAMIADGVDPRIITAYVATMVAATGTIGVKVVNAGGIDAFKFNTRVLDVDDRHPRYDITPGQVIRALASAVAATGLRHPLHVHCSNLGVPGNIASTLATIHAADGQRLHLTHAQFHAYGKTKTGMTSAAAELAAAVNNHPHVTVDVGQVIFGQTVTVSADAMHQCAASHLARPPVPVLADVSTGGGCGVVPFKYRRRSFVSGLQFAIGLELFLMIDDPTRVFLTTDHPNGGPFTAYPMLMRWLSDPASRDEMIDTLHPDAAAATSVRGMDRRYSMRQLHAMTRGGPADILGLRDRGRLRVGDVADVVIYGDDDDLAKRFATPTHVWVAGRPVRRGGQSVAPDPSDPARPPHRVLAADRGRLMALAADLDPRGVAMDYARRYGGIDPSWLWIDEDEFAGPMHSRLTTAGHASPPAEAESRGGRGKPAAR